MKDKMNQKGLSIVIIFLALVIFISIAGYFVWVKNQQSNLYQSPATQDETMNWKTYRNDKYGFEVKYPPFLKYEEINYSPSYNFIPFSDQTGKYNVFGFIVSNKTEDLLFSKYDDTGWKMIGESLVNGYRAQKLKHDYPGNSETVYLIKEKNIVIWFLYPNNSKPSVSEEIFNQILSTFKFIK